MSWTGLGWLGLNLIGMIWAVVGHLKLDRLGLGWVGFHRIGSDWNGLGYVVLCRRGCRGLSSLVSGRLGWYKAVLGWIGSDGIGLD